MFIHAIVYVILSLLAASAVVAVTMPVSKGRLHQIAPESGKDASEAC
jgi:hypothetical protein